MRHLRNGRKLGVKSKHRRALLRNLLRNLVLHKRIKTTVTRAKEASSFADKMITLAKRSDLHARRLLISETGSPAVADMLIRQIAPQFKKRSGGYTRVLKLGAIRPGDAVEVALLEFTELFELPKKKEKKAKKAKPASKSSEGAAAEGKEGKKESSKEIEAESKKAEKADKQEAEKKGGFLGKLRKFLKGDE